MRDYITRKEYDAWISECVALVIDATIRCRMK